MDTRYVGDLGLSTIMVEIGLGFEERRFNVMDWVRFVDAGYWLGCA